ncbi:MAG: DUF2764 family protein [Christensenellaceae bacterium]|nr:DUF2764 family protein [Christensenellaceae bacterium]
MAYYYLISQLPSLDGLGENMPMPISEERFGELCDRFAGKKVLAQINGLTLMPPEDAEASAGDFIEKWNGNERDLRLALASVRAAKLGKPYSLGERKLPAELVRLANTAVETDNPLEAEKLLSQHRLELLEAMRPMDNFSDDYLFYYGLKLKLILRMRKFDTDAGEAAYKSIYNSVLNEDKLEDM